MTRPLPVPQPKKDDSQHVICIYLTCKTELTLWSRMENCLIVFHTRAAARKAEGQSNGVGLGVFRK